MPEVPTHDADDHDLQRRRPSCASRSASPKPRPWLLTPRRNASGVRGSNSRLQGGNLHGARLVGRAQSVDDHRQVRAGPEIASS